MDTVPRRSDGGWWGCTFGHRWLVAGGDIYTLSKLLGHSSVNVTEQHYAHLLKEDLMSKMIAVMETR